MKSMRYLETEGIWLLPPPDGESCEIIVAGDKSAPSEVRMPIVENAIAHLGNLRSKAISYLDEFVEREKFAQGSNWYFVGLESGRLAGQPENQFNLYFSIEGDTNGEWSVSFQALGREYYAVAFSRRQY